MTQISARAADPSGDQQATPDPQSGQAASAGGHALDLLDITHRFGDFVAVNDISLSIRGGELVALLGPSGCGKTTLLKIIAGFLVPSAGVVSVDEEPIQHVPANRRGIGIVFQNYALFPHMTIRQNIAYGLRARRSANAEVDERVREMLSLIKLEGMAQRYPRELSGGQQQRVALARALAVQPRILLLDEPFGALDKGLRLDMQIEIKRIQRQFGITSILVTHDQEEALSMADRVAVMNRGVVEQFATPTEIYDAPGSLFVSSFVGTSNLVDGEIGERSGDGRYGVRLGSGEMLPVRSASSFSVGEPVTMAIRPERIRISDSASDRGVRGTVRMAMPLGPSTVYEVQLGDGLLVKAVELRMPETRILPNNTQVFLELSGEDVFPVFPRT